MDELLYTALGFLLAFAAIYVRRRMWSFHGQTAEDYEDGFPAFDLEEHLNGKMVCDGVIFGPLGRVTSTFNAEFDIKWDGPDGVMDEVFHYNDGSTQNRQWVIKRGDDGAFTTTADDVPGGGAGVMSGSAVRMTYRIRVPESAGSHVLDTVDWMYLTADGTIVNRSQFRKFGVKVAELVATIKPKGTS
ncbi:DUF3833 domain containing protein [Sulfitobacter noctilucicola]|uniref:DUF3833 domain-containing protein n=1 Tax=Sulfitobacter noctilucicola TaxID=1342301 RepID=A0A7W6M4M3_9RHOB|nr:DUF3833 family protein [Sulfitobacter noctilucicola]KIN63199.1 DUF3833 domain containing protein [Sulfitobacter noctilucicola]MBB4172276.1 hypothetical protein [Sulfitobacter noctilucicola]